MSGSPMPTPLETRMLPATPGISVRMPPTTGPTRVEIISTPVTEPYSSRAEPEPNDRLPVRKRSIDGSDESAEMLR